jgi:hypothetical protein
MEKKFLYDRIMAFGDFVAFLGCELLKMMGFLFVFYVIYT